MPGLFLPRRFGRVSRRFTDGSTTQGLRTGVATTLYCDANALSVTGWLDPLALPAADRALVIADDNNGSRGWRVFLTAGNNLVLNPIGGSNSSLVSVLTLPVDRWSHFAVRHANMAGMLSADMDFVINGVRDAGASGINGAGHATGVAQHLTIGNFNNGGNASPPVNIAHIAIWQYKISDGISADLWAGATPLDFPYGLIGYWPMDGSGKHGMERDLSPRGKPLYTFGTAAPAWGPPVARNFRLPARNRPAYQAPASSSVVAAAIGVANASASAQENGSASAVGVENAAASIQVNAAAAASGVTSASATAQVNGAAAAVGIATDSASARENAAGGAVGILNATANSSGVTAAAIGVLNDAAAPTIQGAGAAAGAANATAVPTLAPSSAATGVLNDTGALQLQLSGSATGVLNASAATSTMAPVVGVLNAAAAAVEYALAAAAGVTAAAAGAMMVASGAAVGGTNAGASARCNSAGTSTGVTNASALPVLVLRGVSVGITNASALASIFGAATAGLEPHGVDFTASLAAVEFVATVATVDFAGIAGSVDFAGA